MDLTVVRRPPQPKYAGDIYDPPPIPTRMRLLLHHLLRSVLTAKKYTLRVNVEGLVIIFLGIGPNRLGVVCLDSDTSVVHYSGVRRLAYCDAHGVEGFSHVKSSVQLDAFYY